MDAATLATEATRYLEAVELFRSLGGNLQWRPEAEEIGSARLMHVRRPRTCDLCTDPLVLNGRHLRTGR